MTFDGFGLLPSGGHPLDSPLGQGGSNSIDPFGFKPRQKRIVFAVMVRQPNGQVQKFLFDNWGQAMALYRKALKSGYPASKPVKVIA